MNTVPSKAPFGAVIVWGAKGVGKTLACLNSPWTPVHVIDTENSSKEYYIHQEKLLQMGILKNPFTRAECLTLADAITEMRRCTAQGMHFGTLVIDTGGQWSEWIASEEHMGANSEKMGQIVWGKIRDRLRRAILVLSGHCDCILLTAHEREYKGKYSPRCNPALLEIAAISLRLLRDPNRQIPSAQNMASRIPFFPPVMNEFTIAKMLNYFDLPADWNNLAEGDKIIPEEPVASGGADEE